MSIERVAELRKLVEQAQGLKARAEASVEHAQTSLQESLTKLKALGVETAEEALKASEEARTDVKVAIGKIEEKLKEAIKRD